VKQIRDSKEMLGQKKRALVERWNKEVLCRKPTKQAIRNRKRAIQSMRRDRRDIVADQDVYIVETIKQEGEMRKYKE